MGFSGRQPGKTGAAAERPEGTTEIMTDTATRQAAASPCLRRRTDPARRHRVQVTSPSSTSSASIPTTPPLTPPGRARPSRPWTMRTCAISSFTCTACSIRTRPDARGPRDGVLPQAPGALRTGALRRGIAARRLSAPRLAHRTVQARSAEHLRLCRREPAGHLRACGTASISSRPSCRKPQYRAGGADLALRRRRDERHRRREARHPHDPRIG